MHQAYFKNPQDIWDLSKKGLPFSKNNFPFTENILSFTKNILPFTLKHVNKCDQNKTTPHILKSKRLHFSA